LRTASVPARAYRKAVPGVPAPEKHVNQFRHHGLPSTPGFPLGFRECAAPGTTNWNTQSRIYLDSRRPGMVSTHSSVLTAAFESLPPPSDSLEASYRSGQNICFALISIVRYSGADWL
jgi:hypothetical protein